MTLLKRILIIFALLSGFACAQTTTTVTGTIKDLSGALVTSGKITFTLRPATDVTMSGLARFTTQTITCLINASGLVKAQDGVSACTITMNTALQPQGSGYLVGFWPYSVKTATIFMYALTSTVDITTVVSTQAQLPSLGGVVDTFTNQTIGGAKTFSGSIADPLFNGIVYDDGSQYPCSPTGITAGLAATAGQFNAEGCTSGFTAANGFNVGGSSLKGIFFKHPSGSTWGFNVTDGVSCGVKVFSGNSFGGDSATNSGFTMQAASTANMDSLLCNDATAGNYTRLENLLLYSPVGATLANGALHIENAQDGSSFRNITVGNYSGIGALWRKNCCTAATWNLVSNGNYGANALPFWVNADSTHNVNQSPFFASSFAHPGVGKNTVLLTGTNRFFCSGLEFFGLYMEPQKSIGDTTTPALDDNCYGAVLIAGADLDNDDAASTRYMIQIEAGGQGITGLNLTASGTLNIINDLINGVTVSTAALQSPINYISIPSYFTSFNILKNGLPISETSTHTGASGKDVCDADSTLHALKCSYNNAGFLPVPLTGNTGGTHSDSGFLQSKRGVAGCTTAASIGGVCATAITITWPVAFADSNYSVSCQGTGAITNFPIMGSVTARTTTTATLQTMALTAAAASFATVDCVAVHD